MQFDSNTKGKGVPGRKVNGSNTRNKEDSNEKYEPLPPERPEYICDNEDRDLEISVEKSKRDGNERRMFGKHHTMTLYKFFNKIKDKYRNKREEQINEIEKEEKQNQKENKLGGINHFNKQMEEPEYKDLQ